VASPATDNDFQVSIDGVTFVTLRSLGVPNPHPIWHPGVVAVKLGDNSIRILGSAWVEWRWGFLSQAARDALRTYCSGGSAFVYIITPTTENVGGVPNASKGYNAQMVWPAPDAPEDPQAGRRMDFTIIFRQMVEVSLYG
jgi:hypothetical protein